jgi:hypothetical protein
MPPIDPGQHWLEAGITGLPRQREWDAVATVSAPGSPGDEAQFVALDDDRLLLEDAPAGFDPAPFAAALAGGIEPPYRAVARCRPEYWAAGASVIEVVPLGLDPRGTDFELAFDGETRVLTVDGMPSGPAGVEALRSLAESRVEGAYSAHAHRLADDLFEVLILPL